MSATGLGMGRLRIWEDFAIGVRLGTARSVGQWDASSNLRWNPSGYVDGLSRFEPWAIVRLDERLQLQGWAPVFLNDRQSGGETQLAGGVGDLGAALRFEAISLGEYEGLPGLAFTLTAIAPTGRRPEETAAPLFAGATGRGAWGAALALESEYATMPWFVKLDAGFVLHRGFARPDTGAWQRYGPAVQVALSAGNELVADRLVVSGALSGEWEAPVHIDGGEVPGTGAYSCSIAGSVSWSLDPHWTLIGDLASNVWPDGAGMNRDARVGITAGVRYGHF